MSQIGQSCADGGNPIALVYVGDGTSLLGSPAEGISFSLWPDAKLRRPKSAQSSRI